MSTLLRTGLFVIFTMAVPGCGESFVAATSGGATGGSSGSAGAGSASSGGAGDAAGSSAGGAAAGSTGAGATGGAPCDAVDHDGDGLSQCDGDCDDANKLIHPGAMEICGDGADDDCDGADDSEPPCDGLGTFVSQAKGTVGGKGTMDEPVATISEGIAHAEKIGIPTAVLVAAGVYTEDVTLTGSVSMMGGYDPDDWSGRDPKAYVSKIKSVSPTGFKIVAADDGVTVDGFVIEAPAVLDGSDSIGVLIDSGSPSLTSCSIRGGASSGGSGASVGVRVISSSALGGDVRLLGDTIESAAAKSGSYAVEVAAASMNVTLGESDITSGMGADSIGLLISQAGLVKVQRNTIQSGTATGSNLPSSSLGVWARQGKLLLDANRINPDQLQSPPMCFTPGAWCGGVRVSTGDATLTNNTIHGSVSDLSAGVHLLLAQEPLTNVVVSSNRISAGGHNDPGTLSAVILLEVPLGQSGKLLGRLRSNILVGGLSESNYGVWERELAGSTCGPAALDHNLFYFPIDMPNAGVLYRDYNGVTGSDITSLDLLPGAGQNQEGNPQLSGDGHLLPGSPCEDAGAMLDAPDHDLDQDERPMGGGFDIGPDELIPPP